MRKYLDSFILRKLRNESFDEVHVFFMQQRRDNNEKELQEVCEHITGKNMACNSAGACYNELILWWFECGKPKEWERAKEQEEENEDA